MPVSETLAQSKVGRQIAGLALSAVRADNPMLLLRVVQWHNALGKLGLTVPFWVVHDVGLLAVMDPASVPVGPRPGMDLQTTRHAEWVDTLAELAQSEVMEKARSWRLSDDLLAVLLLRVLGPTFDRFYGSQRRSAATLMPLDAEIYRDLEGQLPALFSAHPMREDVAFLDHLSRERLRLIIAVEQVDLDTLRLVGMFGAAAGAATALGMLDLLNVFQSPEANDIVNFSLDLLPSVLETKRASGQQIFSVDGYSGVERRGNIDSLVLSELAYDPDLFDKRFVEKEVFFYAHEKQQDEERRLHYICVDASASMRGQRAVFARGLALTLVKKLMLRGEEVYLRFFDSRLYEPMHARPGRTDHGGISVPYVLSFKGERGRNYAKVFALLANDIDRLCRRERRTPILYVITHAECHIPLDTVERLRKQARLYGIFMLPSQGELDLDYVHRLHTVQVVNEAALTQKDERARVALDIVEHAARKVSDDDGSDVDETSEPWAERISYIE